MRLGTSFSGSRRFVRPTATVPALVFEVGMTVWREGQVGWEQGRLGSGVDHDACYITTESGSTMSPTVHQLIRVSRVAHG